MRARDVCLCISLVGVAACPARIAPARDQWEVHVATDAPVPQLGQQLYVEFIDSDGNDLAPVDTRLIDGSRSELWPVSFGVVPRATGAPLRLRVRLYRLDDTGADGAPQGGALLDATAVLPPVGSGVTDVAMTLSMACFGVAPDLPGHRTCDPTSGSLAAEPVLRDLEAASVLVAPGSWPPAAVVPCSAAPPAGMTCVPGGLFLMGATRYFSSGDDTDPTPERLVQLSPFAIDSDEVTVGAIQPLVQSGALSPPLSTDPDPQAVPPECTYGSGNALLPATCVSWAQADQACRLLGKRLPTEAEWEYVAGNVGLGTPFPWGPDTNVCSNAVVARGRLAQAEPTECLSAQSDYSPGPLAGGATTDATALGVMNLGGNVDEWVADVFGAYSGPCWTGATLLVNPQCQAAMAGASAHTIRGGSWQTSAFTAYTYERDYSRFAGDPAAVGTGFRCAVDM